MAEARTRLIPVKPGLCGRWMVMTIVSAIMIVLLSFPANAQGSVSGFDHRKVLENARAMPLVVDETFEQRTGGRSFPLHFELQVPTADDLMAVGIDTSASNRYVRVMFKTPAGPAAEVTDIYSAMVPAGPLKDREAYLSQMLRERTLPALGEMPELQVLGVIPSNVGRHPAVELIASFVDARTGPTLLRIVGIFPPQGEWILVTISWVVYVHVPFSHPRDLAGTLSYAMLETLNFRHRRLENGSMEQLLGALVREK